MENEREMQFYLFRKYLTGENYKPKVVFGYTRAVEKVLEEERMSIEEFNRRINEICCLYDIGGAKESLGERGQGNRNE